MSDAELLAIPIEDGMKDVGNVLLMVGLLSYRECVDRVEEDSDV
jgi:hypothetical protein